MHEKYLEDVSHKRIFVAAPSGTVNSSVKASGR